MSPVARNVIIGVVVCVIFGAGAFAILRQPSTQTSPTPQESSSNQGTATSGASSKPAGDTSDAQAGSFTLAQVATHSTPNDCWMAIEGGAYNVTSYISSHPGGSVILRGCGKDATSLFNTQGGRGTSHNSQATDELARLKVGTLSP